MATSDTYNFAPDLAEILEEAYEQCGLEIRSGYDYTTGVRSLNLLLIEWQNRGINFWTLDHTTVTLTAASPSHDLSAVSPPIQDIIQCHIRTNAGTATQTDHPVTRWSVSEYEAQPNKLAQGRPTNFYLDRDRGGPALYLWPTPDQAYTLGFYRIREIQDAGNAGDDQPDVPKRFIPALIAGLAHRISLKKARGLSQELKMAYEEQWRLAEASDRSRTSMRLVPRVRRA